LRPPGLAQQLVRFFFSSRRRHTRFSRDWSSDVCSSDLRVTRRTGALSYARQGIGVLLIALVLIPFYRLLEGRETGLAGRATIGQIGRASCREREGGAGGPGSEQHESARTARRHSTRRDS